MRVLLVSLVVVLCLGVVSCDAHRNPQDPTVRNRFGDFMRKVTGSKPKEPLQVPEPEVPAVPPPPPINVRVKGVRRVSPLKLGLSRVADKFAFTGKFKGFFQTLKNKIKGDSYNATEVLGVAMECAKDISTLSLGGRLAAAYELNNALIEGTLVLADVFEGLKKDKDETYDSEKMDKTTLRLFDGLLRAFVMFNTDAVDKEESKKINLKQILDNQELVASKLKGTAEDGKTETFTRNKKSVAKDKAAQVYKALVADYKTAAQRNAAKVPCMMLDAVFLAQRERLVDNNDFNDKLRDVITAGISTTTNVVSGSLGIAAGASSGFPPAALALGISAGATKLVGVATELLVDSVISKENAIKQFRRGLRINLLDGMRGMLFNSSITDTKTYNSDCHVEFFQLMDIIHSMMLRPRFRGVFREEIKGIVQKCAGDDGTDHPDFSEYAIVGDMLSHTPMPFGLPIPGKLDAGDRLKILLGLRDAALETAVSIADAQGQYEEAQANDKKDKEAEANKIALDNQLGRIEDKVTRR